MDLHHIHQEHQMLEEGNLVQNQIHY